MLVIMGQVTLVACRQPRVALHPLRQWLAWERNWVRTCRSVSRCAVDYVGSPFTREQWLCPLLLMTREWLSSTGTTHKKCMSGVHGLAWKAGVSYWSGFPLEGVHRFESPRLSNMSNRLFVAAIK
jgi:hypothetical protein